MSLLKRAVLIFILTLGISQAVSAQENLPNREKGSIGITFSSFGENDVVRFNELEGAAGYRSDKFFTAGINYIYPLRRWLDLETGIEYSHQDIIIEPNLPPSYDRSPYGADFSLINIPVTLRANFLKYFFVNGGLLLDLDAGTSPVDSQSGIGAILGLGLKINITNKISVFANPYSKGHSLLAFSFEDNHQRLMENGFRFGVVYKL